MTRDLKMRKMGSPDGYSKVIPSGGGLILANKPTIAERLVTLLDSLPRVLRWHQVAGLLKFAAVALLVRSHHLGPVAGVWAGAFRGKHDAEDFEVLAQSPVEAAVGCSLYCRLKDITALRRRNADWFVGQLSGIPGFRLPRILPDSGPVWLRYPIVVENTARKARLLALLKSRGVNASEMYDRKSHELVCSLALRPRPCPSTEYLTQRMVNLPTHPYVTDQDREEIARAFRSVFLEHG